MIFSYNQILFICSTHANSYRGCQNAKYIKVKLKLKYAILKGQKGLKLHVKTQKFSRFLLICIAPCKWDEGGR